MLVLISKFKFSPGTAVCEGRLENPVEPIEQTKQGEEKSDKQTISYCLLFPGQATTLGWGRGLNKRQKVGAARIKRAQRQRRPVFRGGIMPQ